MADLSGLFGAPQVQRRATPFDLAAPKAAEFKRRIVMSEAMQQDLAPEDGEQFFKFVGRRLFELGDIEGAMAVTEKQREMLGQQAAARQQQFENELKVGRYNLDVGKFNREGRKQPKRSTLMTGAQIAQEFNVEIPAELRDAAIEVQYGENGQPVDYQVLSKGGTNVKVDVDARPPQVGGQEATKPTLNKLQDQVLQSNEGIARLAQINETFDERFLQLGTRLQEFGGRIKDFLGRATPEDQALITEFQDFKSSSLDNLNLTLNQLSGAAVSPQEYKRIAGALPNPGTGLFDGDSPTQFMSKLRRAMRDIKLARARANFVLSGGGTVEDITNGKLTINGMAQLMQTKINEWDKAGFSKEQIRVKLRETFGEF